MPPSTRGNPEDERETAQKGPNRARDNRPGMAQETQPRSLPSCSHFSSQLASPRLRLVPRAIRCALRLLSQGVGDASRRGGHTLRKLPKATRVRTSPKSIPPSNISKGGCLLSRDSAEPQFALKTPQTLRKEVQTVPPLSFPHVLSEGSNSPPTGSLLR